MSIRKNKYPVVDLIPLNNVLVSTFDKSELYVLVDAIIGTNPGVIFYSTGGTGKEIIKILGELQATKHYISVEDFTKAPEMEGGLVKTLHPKIHAGLLAERGNPAHEEYLYRVMEEMTKTLGVYSDVFIGNLYPFEKVISKEDSTPEDARVNIDIGGPTMTMAAAKNWHSVAVITSPDQYPDFVHNLKMNGGKTSLQMRFQLAKEAMKLIGNYRSAISKYFQDVDYESAIQGLDIIPE